MARLLRTNDGRYRCSNCFITSKDLRLECPFCGQLISNYEYLLIENFTSEEFDKTKDSCYNIDRIKEEEPDTNDLH